MTAGKRQAVHALQQPLVAAATAPIVNTASPTLQPKATPARRQAAAVRRSARIAEQVREEAEACAKLASLPVQHQHAAGIDVGDASHWGCVETTPDGSERVREFPAHTPGLRQLVAWLRHCGVTTIALEATGVYGHVLYLTLLEAGLHVVTTSPKFTKQIQGRQRPTSATASGFSGC